MVNICRKISLFSENECHLWHVNLLPYLELDKNDTLLNKEEQARKERYVFEAHQQRFGACRKLLKLILADYLNEAPAHLLIDTHEFGKPFLKGLPIKFNLSHSGDYFFLGITSTHEVGVDIEQVKQRDFLGLARHSFSIDETAQVSQASPQEQSATFYKIWSQKEAYIKLDGRGLRYPLKAFSVSSKDGGGLISSKDNKHVPLISYQSAPELYAAYCMDAPMIEPKFFSNDNLPELLGDFI